MTVLGFLLVPALPVQEAEGSVLRRMEREVAAIVEQVRPWLVRVTAAFEAPGPELLYCSGFAYAREYVVTDAGAVEGATELRVSCGERTFTARPVASDRRTGVAVLQVPAADLKPPVFAEEPCRPGAWIVAVGNAYGMSCSVSVGIVGGTGRSILVGGRKYEDLIQMTAAVHPGDGGGMVADASGRLVGMIHSVCPAGAPDREGAGGMSPLWGKDLPGRESRGPAPLSFAVPIPWVRFSADRILRYRRMVRGWLGVTARPVDEAVRLRWGIPEGVGAEIVRVEPESPARKARLQTRDILLELDGETVRDLEALRRKIAAYEPPVKVRAVFLRQGERREVELQIEVDPQR